MASLLEALLGIFSSRLEHLAKLFFLFSRLNAEEFVLCVKIGL